jgi:hypothetical protein
MNMTMNTDAFYVNVGEFLSLLMIGVMYWIKIGNLNINCSERKDSNKNDPISISTVNSDKRFQLHGNYCDIQNSYSLPTAICPNEDILFVWE